MSRTWMSHVRVLVPVPVAKTNPIPLPPYTCAPYPVVADAPGERDFLPLAVPQRRHNSDFLAWFSSKGSPDPPPRTPSPRSPLRQGEAVDNVASESDL